MGIINKIKYFKKKIEFKDGNKLKNRLVNDNAKKIVLMGSPEYNNLGDHVIADATRIFIENNVKDKIYVEIPEKQILYNLKNVKKLINDNDILLLQGGGNMGDIYPDQVLIRKRIIENFKNNKIIIMPQTIHFDNKENAKIPQYYFKHKDLTIFAREEKSYSIFKEIYVKEKVYLVPDIVMYMIGKINIDKKVTDNILLCIRKDKESNNGNYQELVENILNKNKLKFENTTTVLNYNVNIEQREDELKKLFSQFANTKLIITDRLHGMIIAAITKTPCLVLSTFNHKVLCSYEWIKDLGYITMCKNIEDIEESIKELLKIENVNVMTDFSLKYKDLLKQLLDNCETKLKIK